MQLKEIIVVVIITLAFIILSIFTKRAKPKSNQREKAKPVRITIIIASVVMLALLWIGVPSGSIYPKLILSVIAIVSIYSNLKGWVMK